MTSTAAQPAPRGWRRVLARLDDRHRGEGGFVLLETMIALTLITVIMAAVSVEYVNGIVVSAQQRSSASASQLASSAIADLRAYNATDLVQGRSQADVLSQRNRLRAIERVQPWISGNANVTAYSGGTQRVVPTTAEQVTVGGKVFSVDRYLECTEDATNGACASQANLVRVVVAVVWSERGCPTTGCAFVTVTLLDIHADPTFDINQPLPAAPIVKSPGDQVVAIGDKIGDKAGDTFPAVRFLVEEGTGAEPFTWSISGTLPAGLSYSPDGGVSGIPTGPASDTPTSTTVTVTDAFQRQASATVRWTVKPAVALAEVGPQASLFKRQASEVALRASGGAGGYVFSATGLPPGITLDSATGTINGTPTAVGDYTVVATVKDSTGKRSASRTFTWTVRYPPLAVSQPGTQNATKDQADELQITADGGSGEYTYAVNRLPAGLSLNTTTGRISGTPTTVSSVEVTVTVTDQKAKTDSGAAVTTQATFTWKVLERPTVTSPGNRTNSRTAAVDVALTSTCPNAPCTYTISGQPGGIGIDSGTGRISGTVASDAAVKSYSVTVTTKDAAGATATATFSWSVVAAPTITTPANQTGNRGSAQSLAVSSTCGHTSCTFSATGLPGGLSIDTSNGRITGTLANDAQTSTVRVTIRDASGVTRTTEAFTWTVNARLTFANPGRQTLTAGSYNQETSPLVGGGTKPYSQYKATGLPNGVTINANTGVISGTAAAGTYNVNLTVSDATGATASTGTFTVQVNP